MGDLTRLWEPVLGIQEVDPLTLSCDPWTGEGDVCHLKGPKTYPPKEGRGLGLMLLL